MILFHRLRRALKSLALLPFLLFISVLAPRQGLSVGCLSSVKSPRSWSVAEEKCIADKFGTELFYDFAGDGEDPPCEPFWSFHCNDLTYLSLFPAMMKTKCFLF